MSEHWLLTWKIRFPTPEGVGHLRWSPALPEFALASFVFFVVISTG